jgi:starch phosphorylase
LGPEKGRRARPNGTHCRQGCYLDADQRLIKLYADAEGWARRVILSVAGSGMFSSDRTIAQYAAEIWDAKPCPIT